MLAYAAPRPGREGAHPRILMLIVAGHVLAVGAVMLAKSDLPTRFDPTITILDPIALPKDPPPRPRDPVPSEPRPSHVTTTRPEVPTFAEQRNDFPSFPTGPIAGTGPDTLAPPQPPFVLPHAIVRHGPQMATAESRLRPPYPQAKQMIGEEATLTLKLSIDAAGRVVAVEPIGSADRAFLDSARKHLLSVWRFTPATEDGKPVPSTKVITLHFELGEA